MSLLFTACTNRRKRTKKKVKAKAVTLLATLYLDTSNLYPWKIAMVDVRIKNERGHRNIIQC